MMVPAPPPREETRVERYYTPILISDAITATLVAAATIQDHAGNAFLGGANYFLAPMIIHGVKGRVGISFASMGVRAGFPLAALVLLDAARPRGEDQDKYLLPGLFAGMIGASILDNAVFARRTVTVTTSSIAMPLVSVQRGGATLGLGGAW